MKEKKGSMDCSFLDLEEPIPCPWCEEDLEITDLHDEGSELCYDADCDCGFNGKLIVEIKPDELRWPRVEKDEK